MAAPTYSHYSLLDYTATIKLVKDTTNNDAIFKVELGGSQSYMGSIKVSRDKENVTRTTDATGSTVYSFSNSHAGSVEFELSFVSTAMDALIKMVTTTYLNSPANWKNATFNIDIARAGYSSQPIISLMGCMLKKIPDWEVSGEPGMRPYEFEVAQIEERTITELQG